MRLVLIEWEDSHGSTGGWHRLDGVVGELLVVRSVGWMLHDNAALVVIYPHIVEPDPPSDVIERQGRGEMTIPRSCIRSVLDLTEALKP